MDVRQNYRDAVNTMGKKEFTLAKMQEYGFWPSDLKTPYEKQQNETEEEYKQRKELLEKYEKIVQEINECYEEKETINQKLKELQKKYDDTWDYEKIRKDVAQTIMKESIERRKQRKEQKALEQRKRSEEWKKYKREHIVYIGTGYSGALFLKDTEEEKLVQFELPVIKDDKELAEFLEIEYQQLRYLTYHRDVVKFDLYDRYTIPKKKGGVRHIAAPKKILKQVQRTILEKILYQVPVSEHAHGFVKEKSILSGAKEHKKDTKVELLINMDLENFFPTITFERVRGMFQRFGYSGYVASLLAMLCTYCERMEMEVKGETVYVKTSDRVLPQGSPASPMITNIICKRLDGRLHGLATKYGFSYSRYADDMSFSFPKDYALALENNGITIGNLLGVISKIIEEEGFCINQKKTKFLREHNQQAITGIVIQNDEIGVPKKWVKNFRSCIHHAQVKKENGERVPNDMLHKIRGMMAWLTCVNAKRYEKLIMEAKKLLQE